MTIGEAIKAEREAKGITRADVDSAPSFMPGDCEMLERWDDLIHFPAGDILNLRRLGLDPIGRMLKAEEGVKLVALLAEDAEWRKDPVGAAEAVTGTAWVDDGDGYHELDDGMADFAWVLNVNGGNFQWEVAGRNLSSYGSEATHDAAMILASSGVVEAVIKGDLALPEGCPGLSAITK